MPVEIMHLQKEKKETLTAGQAMEQRREGRWNFSGIILIPEKEGGTMDLHGMNFRGTCFAGADLSGVDLEGSDFMGADLQGAKLRGANLKNVDFMMADLRDVDFGTACVEGTSFRRADMRGSQNLERVMGLESASFFRTYVTTRQRWVMEGAMREAMLKKGIEDANGTRMSRFSVKDAQAALVRRM